MNLGIIAWKNLWARPWSTLISLILLVLGVSIISLLLQLNTQLDDQFKKNIRGIDMVVGAKGSPLQLVLSSVYHIDNPTGNIPLKEAIALQRHPLVEKWIPMAYGDNFKGYRILGTEWSYVDHYHGSLYEGRQWKEPFEVVLGSKVAEQAGLRLGDTFFGAHGDVEDADIHDEHAYTVVGILVPSQTVIDQLVLTSMNSVWDIHSHEEAVDDVEVEESEADLDEEEHDHEEGEGHDHSEEEEQDITTVLIKFKNPMAMMQLPRMINQQTSMQAALTAIEVNRLFDLFAVGLATLRGIALAIVIISAISVFFSLYNSLRGRKYELALMRTMGASQSTLLSMILMEGLILATVGGIIGLILSRAGLSILSGIAEESTRYEFDLLTILPEEGALLGLTMLVGVLSALLPAISAYNTDISRTLTDGKS